MIQNEKWNKLGILGIIIGHKFNNLKIVKSIVVGFGIYIIS